MNEYIPKIDKVYDADNLEQCYNIMRSKRLYIPNLRVTDYAHDKDKRDLIIEKECRYEGDQYLITISNQAWLGWTYYKPDLYVRGQVDGNGRMIEHRKGSRTWWDMSTLAYS
jgi:hypothetical protein